MGNRNDGHFRNILIGFDGSEAAAKALDVGFAIARTMDSKLDIVAVAQPPEPAASVELETVIHDAHERYEKSLQQIAHNASENGISVETHIMVGQAAEQIIDKAERDHTNLVIVGQRGMSGFERLVLGSVSERVLRYAPCPVLVVR